MITSADIELYYNLTLTTEQKDRLDNYIIPALTSFIERYCNRTFAKATNLETFDGGVDSFFVKNPPIDVVNSITVDGGALDAGDYKVYPTYIRLFTTPSNHTTDVLIDYDGGFDPIPQDVLNAMAKWAYSVMLDDDDDTATGGSSGDIKRFTAGSVTVEYGSTESTRTSTGGVTGTTQAQVVGVPDYIINTLQYYRLTPIR